MGRSLRIHFLPFPPPPKKFTVFYAKDKIFFESLQLTQKLIYFHSGLLQWEQLGHCKFLRHCVIKYKASFIIIKMDLL